MKKIDQAEEKRARNALFAEKYRKKESKKKRVSRFKNWCRIKGHAPECNCVYPTREEIFATLKSHRAG